MATPVINESRRDFLKSSAAMGGGLVIGFALPGAARFAEAATAAAFHPNAFIRITPDNRVTVIVGLSEMGRRSGSSKRPPILRSPTLFSRFRQPAAPRRCAGTGSPCARPAQPRARC